MCPSRQADGSIVFKIVYVGPSLAGKTTAIQYLYNNENIAVGKLVSIKGGSGSKGAMGKFGGFFDRMMARVGNITFQIYTVAGMKQHAQLRKVILKGVDGLVFVWDSQRAAWKDNLEAINELISLFKSNLLKMPFIVMLNKIDLPGGVSTKDVGEILQKAKLKNATIIEGIAINGENVRKAFDLCAKSILKKYLSRKEQAS
ncbi:MAG: ADP-ribosylation factor-like protein [Candidatus Helarchaeota archaeon]